MKEFTQKDENELSVRFGTCIRDIPESERCDCSIFREKEAINTKDLVDVNIDNSGNKIENNRKNCICDYGLLSSGHSEECTSFPSYYKINDLELFKDVIKPLCKDLPGDEAFCVGNILKYVVRYKKKGGLKDLEKAQQYLGWLMEMVK